MSAPVRSLLRRRAALLASGTAVLLAVGGGATAAFAGSADGTSTDDATACAPTLRAVLRATPPELREDLRALRQEPKGERADDRREVREKALDGEYGMRVRRIARVVASQRASGEPVLPAALRADLKELRTTTEPRTEERRDAATGIVEQALDGAYGDRTQQRAQQVQERRQERCSGE